MATASSIWGAGRSRRPTPAATSAACDISGTTSGASVISLDGSGAVNLGGQTLTLTNAAGTFNGAIGGSGGLTLTSGAETLSGNSSYQGGTTIMGASLSVSSDANMGNASGGLTLNSGTLVNTATVNHLGLGWQHAWGDTLPTASMRFSSGSGSFDIAGLPVARNAGTVSGGIRFTVTPAVSVDASYQGQFGQRASDQAARISVDWRF